MGENAPALHGIFTSPLFYFKSLNNYSGNLLICSKFKVPACMTPDKKIIELPTAEGYDRWSSIYETNGNPLMVLDEREFDRFLQQVSPGDRFVDLGCGTGRHTLRLGQAGARVTGVDGSEGMLALARQKEPPNTEFVIHDFSNALPFPDKSFDGAISTLVLEHIPDLLFFFREIHRVTKANPLVYLTAMHPAMLLKSNQANFTDPETGVEIRPKGYPYEMADFVQNLNAANWKIDKMEEFSVPEDLASQLPKANKYLNWPMLVTFYCQKM